MKVFFREIRQGNLDAVAKRLRTNADLVDAVATARKKDHGQSPLQVAIKSANFAIADLLLDHGANPHFIETSDVNPWNTPVLHDAIRATAFSSRFTRNHAPPSSPPNIVMMSTLEDFRQAFHILTRLLDAGADPNATDSYGNPALLRATLDARQIITEPLQPELQHDLKQLFGALISAGADLEWIDNRTGQTLQQHFGEEPVAQFFHHS